MLNKQEKRDLEITKNKWTLILLAVPPSPVLQYFSLSTPQPLAAERLLICVKCHFFLCFPQDMFCFLSQKGPLTKAISRRSANVKCCRELKERLNSGSEAHLDCESVFVIASVLKVRKVLPSSTAWYICGERQLVSFIMTLFPSAKNHIDLELKEC